MSNKAKKVLGKKPVIGMIQDIPISTLHDPPCEDRLSLDLEIGIEGYKDTKLKEFLRQCVLKAVYYPEADKLFVVEGKCFFHKAREMKLKKLRCLVVSEIQCEEEAVVERAEHVLRDHKPFHLLEETRFILETKEHAISEQGIKVYGQGGKRHGQMTLVNVLKDQIPQKEYRIETLNRFGEHIGPEAVKGLYDYLQSKGESLTIYLVHMMNPKLNKAKLRKQIDHKIADLKKKEKSDPEIAEAVALMAYKALFQPKEKPPPKEKPSEREKEAKSGNIEVDKEFRPLSPQDLPSIRESFKDEIVQKVLDIDTKRFSKKKLTAAESKGLFEDLKDLHETVGAHLELLAELVIAS